MLYVNTKLTTPDYLSTTLPYILRVYNYFNCGLKNQLESKNTTRLKYINALKSKVTGLEAVHTVLNYPYYYWSEYKI